MHADKEVNKMMSKQTQFLDYLKNVDGFASYAEISKAGFDKSLIKACLNSKLIKRIDRGIYALPEGSSFSNPDFILVSIKVPRGVICLLSALAFYEATNEIPKYIDMAIPRGAGRKSIKHPPVRFYSFEPKAWVEGIEYIETKGHIIKIYCLARTVADCFKFRNKIGMDVARAALKVALCEKNISPKEIMHYAKINRVERIVKPLLEMML